MVDLTLFRRPAFVGAQTTAFTISASMFAMFLYLTLYLQNILGLSPLQTGLRFLPLSIVSFFAAPIAGRLSARVPIRILLGTGLALNAVAMWLMSRVSTELGLDGAVAGLHRRRRRDRARERAARVDGRIHRAPGARRDGLRHQQHVQAGRDRDRDRGARRDLRLDASIRAPSRRTRTRRRARRSWQGCTTSCSSARWSLRAAPCSPPCWCARATSSRPGRSRARNQPSSARSARPRSARPQRRPPAPGGCSRGRGRPPRAPARGR